MVKVKFSVQSINQFTFRTCRFLEPPCNYYLKNCNLCRSLTTYSFHYHTFALMFSLNVFLFQRNLRLDHFFPFNIIVSSIQSLIILKQKVLICFERTKTENSRCSFIKSSILPPVSLTEYH